MKQRRPLFIAIAVIAMIAAIWSYVFLQNSPRQTLDQRVQHIASQLRCPICQGESVADSPSQLAQQMRGVIRRQLQEGKSEQDIIHYFQSSYGDQIVWSPPWQGFSLLAWLVPIGLLLAGMILLFFVLRDWGRLSPAISNTGDTELANIDDADLATYRTQLEQELAAEDPIFLSGKGVEALGEAKGSTFQSLAPLGVGEELKPRDEAGTQQTPSRPPQETEAN